MIYFQKENNYSKKKCIFFIKKSNIKIRFFLNIIDRPFFLIFSKNNNISMRKPIFMVFHFKDTFKNPPGML